MGSAIRIDPVIAKATEQTLEADLTFDMPPGRDMWRWQTQNPRGYQDDCDSSDSGATNGCPASKVAPAANGVATSAANGHC